MDFDPIDRDLGAYLDQCDELDALDEFMDENGIDDPDVARRLLRRQRDDYLADLAEARSWDY